MTQIYNLVVPFKAAADLRTKIYHFVRCTAAKTVDAHSALAQVSVGVLQNKPNTGQGADVMVNGQTPVFVGAAVAVNVKVTADAAGKAITAAATHHVGGISISASDGTAAQPTVDIILTLGGAPLP